MPQPNKIPLAFAASGDKNTIPESTETTGLASWREGFPAITSAPFSEGGIAPKRADFNGIFNALSAATVWNQQGGVYAYDNLTDYEIGNVVDDSGDLYVCTTANGPGSSVVVPSNDAIGVAWQKLLSGVNGVLSVTNGGTGEQSLPVALMDALPYSATVDYVAGALTTSSGDLYVCIGANGPSTAVAPVTDTTKWTKVILTTATTSAMGYMSAADKTALDGVPTTYLPLSGGAMSGDITNAGKGFLRFLGGSSITDGARLAVSHEDTPGYEGEFWLVARANGTEVSLIGKPNGSLAWDGNNVITSAGGTITGSIDAPTPSTSDSSTKIATTAFVNNLCCGPYKTLGDNYVMNINDFDKIGVHYTIESLSTSVVGNYPASDNVGDWDLVAFRGGPFLCLLGVTPRSDKLYLGRFWNGSFNGWRVI